LPPPPPTSTLSLHDALPISRPHPPAAGDLPPLHFQVVLHHHGVAPRREQIDVVKRRDRLARQAVHHDAQPLFLDRPELRRRRVRSEEHTSELQSLAYLVCRL